MMVTKNVRAKTVVLSGAGISAESGLKTFRDSGGLWEGYDVQEVATPEAWHRNPGLVLRFYNERRRDCVAASPNAAHLALRRLEEHCEVDIITQNIDDLHERAGSTRVLHLHGEILKARSSVDPALVYPLNSIDIEEGDLCELGSQLRPHIVWFGEAVPMIEPAVEIMKRADRVIVVGTSLAVYPAANLIYYAPRHAEFFLVDPGRPELGGELPFEIFCEPATTGVVRLVEQLLGA